MKRKDFTIKLILIGFYLKQFSRNLLLPNLIVISQFFFGGTHFEALEMGLIITALMGASAIACLIFGILADKVSRKLVTIITLIFWSFGLIISGLAVNYQMLLIGHFILGFGSGGYIPIGQAIIADGTPAHKRGHYYGLASIFMFLGMFSGLFIASILSPFWQLPFLIASFSLIVLIGVYCLIGKDYQLGLQEDTLYQKYVTDENYKYDYHLTWHTFKKVLQSKTNLLIFIEGIFSLLGMAIIMFSLYPYLIDGPAHITPLVVSLIFIMFITPAQLIGIFFWGRVGDKFEKKYPRIRIWLIAISISITVPFFMIVFWIEGSPAKITNSIEDAIDNPGILTFIILFVIGSFLLGIYDPNQPPIINSINLPETRGSVYAINRFVEELGGAIGPLVLGIVFESSGQNFSLAISIGMLFFLPGTACWWVILKTYKKDHANIIKTLKERAT